MSEWMECMWRRTGEDARSGDFIQQVMRKERDKTLIEYHYGQLSGSRPHARSVDGKAKPLSQLTLPVVPGQGTPHLETQGQE